jgi:hypothetical protein
MAERGRAGPRRSQGRAPEGPGRIEAATHETVRALGRHLRLERRWGRPWYVGHDLVLSVRESGQGVTVEFWQGAVLARRHPILEGAGRNLRQVKLQTIADATAPSFVALVRAAVELDAAAAPRSN